MSETKDFDVNDIAVFVDGGRIGDLGSVGWDDSKDHELEETIGPDGNVWVISTGETEATIGVKATSPSIPDLESAYEDVQTVSMTLKYAEAEPRETSDFLDGKITSFGPSDDYEIDGMPAYEGEITFDRVEHNHG